jgi:hypothetical protein
MSTYREERDSLDQIEELIERLPQNMPALAIGVLLLPASESVAILKTSGRTAHAQLRFPRSRMQENPGLTFRTRILPFFNIKPRYDIDIFGVPFETPILTRHPVTKQVLTNFIVCGTFREAPKLDVLSNPPMDTSAQWRTLTSVSDWLRKHDPIHPDIAVAAHIRAALPQLTPPPSRDSG